jgi:hypothetical protein
MRRFAMKCKNCGLPKDAHVEAMGVDGHPIWKCPNGSGDTYPAMTDVKVELHYRTGENLPWLARWVHPTGGAGEAASRRPADALELAGRKIDESLEEKSAEQKAIEKAIHER